MRCWLCVVPLLLGCGPSPEQLPAPATPSRSPDIDISRCANSTRAVRTQARHGGYAGVDGFDARGCPAGGGD